jgi:hypothetical protein
VNLDSLLFCLRVNSRTCPRRQRGDPVWRGHLFSITHRGDKYQRQLMIEEFLVPNENVPCIIVELGR